MLEVKLNIVTPYIRCHGNNRRPVKLADKMTSRNTVQIWHNDIHQNQIVF